MPGEYTHTHIYKRPFLSFLYFSFFVAGSETRRVPRARVIGFLAAFRVVKRGVQLISDCAGYTIFIPPLAATERRRYVGIIMRVSVILSLKLIV